MAKDVKIAGASYSSVPSISVPLVGGGVTSFYDCVGSREITENGSVDVTGLASVLVNVAGGGGLPSGISKIALGEHTITSDISSGSTATATGTYTRVTHDLGVVPDMILFYTESNIATTYSELGVMWGNTIIGWRSSSYKSNCFYHGNSTTTVGGGSCNTTYGIRNVNTTTFDVRTHASSSYYWRAGTYKWIAIKF